MKRAVILFLALSSYGLAQTIDEVVIPRKTELFITLQTAINTRTAAPGDSFFGLVSVPFTQNDRIVIPAGSYVKGQVETAKKAGRVKGTGELTLRFNLLILPDGTTREFQVMASSAEGYEKQAGNEQGKIKAESKQGADVGKGMMYGTPIGASVGAVAGLHGDRDGEYSQVRTGALVGAGGGAAVGALVGWLLRNQEVNLTKGTVITVVTDTDIHFAKPAPETPKKPL
jgi:hypothetical protein